MNEASFLERYQSGDEDLPPALVCELYSSALIYWDCSDTLRGLPRPDKRFAWNQTVAALHEDFLAPSFATVQAALLGLTGRPTSSITGNTMNCGRTVALAHILGLNRNPRDWRITDEEKRMRVRLWWGVLIHDCWLVAKKKSQVFLLNHLRGRSSFAYGVPTQISQDQYDVPLPDITTLEIDEKDSPGRIKAAEGFLSLCSLTEVIGKTLPLVYDLRSRSKKDIAKQLRQLEASLDDWEDSIIGWPMSSEPDNLQPTPGFSNLRLGFLTTKMLLCRIALRVSCLESLEDNDTTKVIFRKPTKSATQAPA